MAVRERASERERKRASKRERATGERKKYKGDNEKEDICAFECAKKVRT